MRGACPAMHSIRASSKIDQTTQNLTTESMSAGNIQAITINVFFSKIWNDFFLRPIKFHICTSYDGWQNGQLHFIEPSISTLSFFFELESIFFWISWKFLGKFQSKKKQFANYNIDKNSKQYCCVNIKCTEKQWCTN